MSRTNFHLSINTGLGLATTTAPLPAIADKPAHAGKGNGMGNTRAETLKKTIRRLGNAPAAASQSHSGIDVNIVFDTGAKQAARSHYSSNYAGKSCPPGLAKKTNGCLPPSQAKKYNRGDVVPESVTLYRLLGEVEVKLRPLPAGYAYRYVNGEVLVVAEAARKVIDAVVLLSTL